MSAAADHATPMTTHGTGGAAPKAEPVSLEESLAYCRELTREQAKNFYFGLKLTPEPRRSAGYAVYAFMRACDDLVDQPVEPGKSASGEVGSAVMLARVETFRSRMMAVLSGQDDGLRGEAGGKFWPAFRNTVRTYGIDVSLCHAMLDGQRADLVKTHYADFAELYDYCYKVASIVGLVCIRIWGAPLDAETDRLAEYRGVALQLTNIIRDVVEDAQRGRVYLPADELARFGVTEEELRSGRASAEFDQLIAFQIRRARGYYEISQGLERRLDRECRSTCRALTAIYRELLEEIAARPRAVLAGRVRLTHFQKAWIALRSCAG